MCLRPGQSDKVPNGRTLRTPAQDSSGLELHSRTSCLKYSCRSFVQIIVPAPLTSIIHYLKNDANFRRLLNDVLAHLELKHYLFVKAQQPLRESVAFLSLALRQVLDEMLLGFLQTLVRRDDWTLRAGWIGEDIANEVLVTVFIQPELVRGLLVQVAKFNIRLSDGRRECRIKTRKVRADAFE